MIRSRGKIRAIKNYICSRYKGVYQYTAIFHNREKLLFVAIIRKPYGEHKLKKNISKVFDSEHEAAVWVDKQRILIGKPPINILKPVMP